MGRPARTRAKSSRNRGARGKSIALPANGYRQMYIETLENRMARMEQVMKTLLPTYTEGRSSEELHASSSLSESSDLDLSEPVSGLTEDMGSLLVSHAGDTQYLGLP
jgi:hypothetical protein